MHEKMDVNNFMREATDEVIIAFVWANEPWCDAAIIDATPQRPPGILMKRILELVEKGYLRWDTKPDGTKVVQRTAVQLPLL